MTDQEQVEAIADEFAKVRNEGFNPLKKEDIKTLYFNEYDVPVTTVETVKLHLSQLKTKRGQVKFYVPVKV